MTPLHIRTLGDLTKSFSTFVYSHMQKTAGESPDSTSAPSSQHLSEGGAEVEPAHPIIIDAHTRTNASSGSPRLFLFSACAFRSSWISDPASTWKISHRCLPQVFVFFHLYVSRQHVRLLLCTLLQMLSFCIQA